MSDTPQPGTEPANQLDAQVVEPTKTTFGLNSWHLPTPKWASAAFDLYFVLSKAIVGWLAATHILSDKHQYELTIFITLLLDVLVRGLTKMFGVQVADNKEAGN